MAALLQNSQMAAERITVEEKMVPLLQDMQMTANESQSKKTWKQCFVRHANDSQTDHGREKDDSTVTRLANGDRMDYGREKDDSTVPRLAKGSRTHHSRGKVGSAATRFANDSQTNRNRRKDGKSSS